MTTGTTSRVTLALGEAWDISPHISAEMQDAINSALSSIPEDDFSTDGERVLHLLAMANVDQ